MELSEQLAEQMEVNRIRANKMTNVDCDTLEKTLHEEQEAKMALDMACQMRQLVRHPWKSPFHQIDLKYS